MVAVILTALGVGGATVLGTLGGFFFEKMISAHRSSVDAFAAGMMIVAATCGLILPAREFGGILICCAGIVIGSICLILFDKIASCVHEKKVTSNRSYMLLLAITVHNFPEGMAAGVGYGSEGCTNALLTAFSIAIQNVPEGLVIIGPMLEDGVSRSKTLFLALSTAVVEIIGVFFGYFAAGKAAAIMPFTLSFAGGMMLYVVILEMIPSACKKEKQTVYCILGFVCMLVFDGLF
ncbi:MAG: ZIP family metal transporter [Ruminococcaceae bacterium]|nr:ZIP family metal transporter [Oscillospiraceae bacterium]